MSPTTSNRSRIEMLLDKHNLPWVNWETIQAGMTRVIEENPPSTSWEHRSWMKYIPLLPFGVWIFIFIFILYFSPNPEKNDVIIGLSFCLGIILSGALSHFLSFRGPYKWLSERTHVDTVAGKPLGDELKTQNLHVYTTSLFAVSGGPHSMLSLREDGIERLYCPNPSTFYAIYDPETNERKAIVPADMDKSRFSPFFGEV